MGKNNKQRPTSVELHGRYLASHPEDPSESHALHVAVALPVYGYGMRKLDDGKWQVYIVSNGGAVAPISPKPESKHRALARLRQTYENEYVFKRGVA